MYIPTQIHAVCPLLQMPSEALVSTEALLDAFEAVPAEGSICFPALRWAVPGDRSRLGGIEQVLLTEQTSALGYELCLLLYLHAWHLYDMEYLRQYREAEQRHNQMLALAGTGGITITQQFGDGEPVEVDVSGWLRPIMPETIEVPLLGTGWTITRVDDDHRGACSDHPPVMPFRFGEGDACFLHMGSLSLVHDDGRFVRFMMPMVPTEWLGVAAMPLLHPQHRPAPSEGRYCQLFVKVGQERREVDERGLGLDDVGVDMLFNAMPEAMTLSWSLTIDQDDFPWLVDQLSPTHPEATIETLVPLFAQELAALPLFAADPLSSTIVTKVGSWDPDQEPTPSFLQGGHDHRQRLPPEWSVQRFTRRPPSLGSRVRLQHQLDGSAPPPQPEPRDKFILDIRPRSKVFDTLPAGLLLVLFERRIAGSSRDLQ